MEGKERKVYAIEFAISAVAEGDDPSEIGKLVNIGIEGINIIDAIMGLNLVLPNGSEYEVFTAKLEQVIRHGEDTAEEDEIQLQMEPDTEDIVVQSDVS